MVFLVMAMSVATARMAVTVVVAAIIPVTTAITTVVIIIIGIGITQRATRGTPHSGTNHTACTAPHTSAQYVTTGSAQCAPNGGFSAITFVGAKSTTGGATNACANGRACRASH